VNVGQIKVCLTQRLATWTLTTTMERMMKAAIAVKRSTMNVTGALLLGAAAAGSLQAQQTTEEWLERCNRERNGRATVCEVRESTVAATGSFHVNARPNGGIRVQSWDRSEVLVRARLQANAGSSQRAQEIASEVRVETRPGSASSSGPRTVRNEGWSVSYEVFVPRRTDLRLESVNGGIRASDVNGEIHVSTTNGGIDLSGISGSVRGSSTNGGITVQLAGRSWNGEGLDLRTTNGGVRLTIPDGFAANLEASTVNGGVTSEIPLTVQGRIGRNVNAEINGGGPRIRLRTTNGGISIRRG
jgi:DUF4097 and DUF4098 domain-containing protein YvlB